jgi:hypothetical protein
MAKRKLKGRGGPGRNQGRHTDDQANDLRRVNVMLDDPTIDGGKTIGAGNLSLGIRRAVKKVSKKEEK